LIRSKRGVLPVVQSYYIKKERNSLIPQLLQLYHALPKTVKSKVSFFLFLSNTIDVFGIQLSKKDDIDCDIGWANPRVIK
jgi:hypothetical protein